MSNDDSKPGGPDSEISESAEKNANSEDTSTPKPPPSGDPGFHDLGRQVFQIREYTPLPLILILLFVAEPTVTSATVGTLLIVAGELLRTYAVAFIGNASRTRDAEQVGPDLIRGGPYRWMRNPIYVGNLGIILGVTIFGGLAWLVALALIVFGVQYYLIVEYEESLLKQTFGDEFDAYAAEVPAWLPKKTPKLGDVEWPDSFSPALTSEKPTLMALSLVLVALLLIS